MILVDLFSGIGGFHLGLEMAGFKFEKVYWSEIDGYASEVYRKRFPDGIELGDITKVTGKEILADSESEQGRREVKPEFSSDTGAGSQFIITAGFPCQDISVAGKQAGIKGSRSGLFFEITRLAKALLPRIIYLENVSNIISSNHGRDFGTVLTELAEIGYDAEWNCIPASYLGAPHRRDRIWVVAYPNEFDDDGRGFCSSEVSQLKKTEIQRRKNASDTMQKRLEKWQRQEEERPRTPITGGDWWSVEPAVGRVAHGIPKRVDRLKCLGNAVVPQCVAYIAETVVKPILEAKSLFREKKGVGDE